MDNFPVKKKGRLNGGRPLRALIINPDEQFHVVLRTGVWIHTSNNGLHGGTSISWTSPPFLNFILKRTSPPVKRELLPYKKGGIDQGMKLWHSEEESDQKGAIDETERLYR
jgi:hypothetical protein